MKQFNTEKLLRNYAESAQLDCCDGGGSDLLVPWLVHSKNKIHKLQKLGEPKNAPSRHQVKK